MRDANELTAAWYPNESAQLARKKEAGKLLTPEMKGQHAWSSSKRQVKSIAPTFSRKLLARDKVYAATGTTSATRGARGTSLTSSEKRQHDRELYIQAVFYPGTAGEG
jgi:hypothetical protein